MAPVVEDLPQEPPRSRTGAILAALLAVAAAAGLGWWLSAPDRGPSDPVQASRPPAAAAAPAGPVRYAGATPDRAQVRAAYDKVRDLYGEGGPAALVQASQDCARNLPGDPARLDYCLAFDIYAADILPADPIQGGSAEGGAGAWFHDADARAVALAGAALPAFVSAEGRVGEVRALTLTVLPKAAHRPHALRKAKARTARPRPHVEKAALVRPVRHPARRAPHHRKAERSLAYGVVSRPPPARAAPPAQPAAEDPPL